MQVLIAYGSKRGGTEGLARMIGEEFTSLGFDAVVVPAATTRRIDGADAVVIAGALYASRWHRDARRFARRHADELRARPVWLVASGPLDDSAATATIPPVAHVAKAASKLRARGEVTFGGRLEPDARGFPASAMAKTKSGDWRDAAHVHAWVASAAAELSALGVPS